MRKPPLLLSVGEEAGYKTHYEPGLRKRTNALPKELLVVNLVDHAGETAREDQF